MLELERLRSLRLDGNQLRTLPPELAASFGASNSGSFANSFGSGGTTVADSDDSTTTTTTTGTATATAITSTANVSSGSSGNGSSSSGSSGAVSSKEALEMLWAYLRDLQKGNLLWKQSKVVFVGPEGVGKTSLLKCFKPKARAPTQKSGVPLSTNGVVVERWEAEDDVAFSTWDFGGQMVFTNTHSLFFTNYALYLLVFKLTDEAFLVTVEFWHAQKRFRCGMIFLFYSLL